MIDNPRSQSQLSNSDTLSTQLPNRRSFLFSAAGACGVAAFAACRPSFAAAAGGGAKTPKTITIVQFSALGKPTGKITVPLLTKSESEWKQSLSPISFEVTRHAGTERPFTGSTWNNHERGFYRCICCDNAIFSSETKFESGTGWPSFWQPIAKENIIEGSDSSLGMERTEVTCRECNAHLGHVFDDGPRPTGLRYCMNSAAMRFVKTT